MRIFGDIQQRVRNATVLTRMDDATEYSFIIVIPNCVQRIYWNMWLFEALGQTVERLEGLVTVNPHEKLEASSPSASCLRRSKTQVWENKHVQA